MFKWKPNPNYIYIDDVVNLIIQLLKSKKTNGEILNVGSGKPVKIRFVINEIVRQIKKGYPNFGSIKLRKDEPSKLYANMKKIKKFSKWSPKINLSKGLGKTIDFIEIIKSDAIFSIILTLIIKSNF